MVINATKATTDFGKKFNLALEDFAINFTQALAEEAPVDTGFLKTHITYKLNEGEITIIMPEYALAVENGTAPHRIYPKGAKALHWKSGGKDMFAKWVDHPGTSPNPFITRTYHQQFRRLLIEAIKRQFK